MSLGNLIFKPNAALLSQLKKSPNAYKVLRVVGHKVEQNAKASVGKTVDVTASFAELPGRKGSMKMTKGVYAVRPGKVLGHRIGTTARNPQDVKNQRVGYLKHFMRLVRNNAYQRSIRFAGVAIRLGHLEARIISDHDTYGNKYEVGKHINHKGIHTMNNNELIESIARDGYRQCSWALFHGLHKTRV